LEYDDSYLSKDKDKNNSKYFIDNNKILSNNGSLGQAQLNFDFIY
jgi:hypothetical protein